MENKQYHLRYLPLFEQDLMGTVNYIVNVLQNNRSIFIMKDILFGSVF